MNKGEKHPRLIGMSNHNKRELYSKEEVSLSFIELTQNKCCLGIKTIIKCLSPSKSMVSRALADLEKNVAL